MHPDPRLLLNSGIVYFSVTRRFFFPGHQRSGCLDYRSAFASSRAGVLMDCVRARLLHSISQNRSQSLPSAWPSSLFFRRGITGLDPEAEDGLRIARHDSILLPSIQQECALRFPKPDCYQYFVQMKREALLHMKSQRKSRQFRVYVYPPGKGYLEMRQNLRFSLLGLLGFVFGCTSVWMGVAILDARHLLLRLLP